MGFLSVRFYRYRNLEDAEIPVDAPEVFLIGENGQGKSNFLESIYVLCFGSSFRTRNESLLIRQGEREMAVEGVYTLDAGARNTIRVTLGSEGKEIRLNGKAVRDRKELIEHIPCIVFSHDDIAFVQGAPDSRRWFFNQTLSLYDRTFIDTLRAYGKILRLRNLALRAGQGDLLEVYDQQLAETGLAIQERRAETVTRFNRTFTGLFRTVSGVDTDLAIRYSPSWKGEASVPRVMEDLERRREQDLALGSTGSGPHRDRFGFIAGGRDFSRTASTGQLRLISLMLRVSQAVFFSRETGRKPVLLLDDVLLELDLPRRKRFLSVLPEYEQAFFTFLQDEQYASYRSENTLLYRVEDGAIHR